MSDDAARGLSAPQGEFVSLVRLAAPVVLAQLGWMALGVVDALFVGRLGPNALAAVALGGLALVAGIARRRRAR